MIESQIVARVLPSKCREAVKVLLQEVYGYEDFRNLEVAEFNLQMQQNSD